MNKIITAAILAALSTTATADLTVSGEAGLTSNYIWRGISQSDEDGAIQLGAEVDYNGLFGGLWGSNVDFNDGGEAEYEVDVYGGYRFSLQNNTTVEVGGIFYTYPGANSALNYDFWEVNAGIKHTYSGLSFTPTVGAKVSYSPDYAGKTGEAVYYEVNGSVDITNGVYVDARIGYSDLDENRGMVDYADYGIGVGWKLDNFNVRAGYTDTDIDNNLLADQQWNLSAKLAF